MSERDGVLLAGAGAEGCGLLSPLNLFGWPQLDEGTRRLQRCSVHERDEGASGNGHDERLPRP